MEGHGDGRGGAHRHADDDGVGEIPVAAFLDALELPRAAVARWMDHLDAFFARHGGGRCYADLARLTAETRAALASARPDDPGKDDL